MPKSLKEQRQEQERLTEMLIVLEELFRREDVAAKRIIACLYDIAVVNWINKNVRIYPFNPLLKFLMRFPKPVAKILALRFYLQTQCPKLITDWLYSLVEFKENELLPLPLEVTEVPAAALPAVEVKRLQKKVKLLTGALMTSLLVFVGGFAWLAYNGELSSGYMLEKVHPTTISH